MNDHFMLTIPYRTTSEYGGLYYRQGDLQLHHLGDGTLFLPAMGATQNHYQIPAHLHSRGEQPKQYGKALRAKDRPDGLWVLLKLDGRDAPPMIREWLRYEYYGRPVVNADHIDALEISCIESWPSARLKTFKPAAQMDMDAFRPVPREWLDP